MTISGKTKLAAVIGWPIEHSLSPALHGFWFMEHGLDAAVVPLPVKPENLREVIRCLPLMGFRGAWVTLPHKEQALSLLDEVDGAGKAIGAVNTLIFGPDAKISGKNTDAFGFLENLKAQQPGVQLRGKSAMVLGAGGAASAIIQSLITAGCSKILVSNRTESRAHTLASHWKEKAGYPVDAVPWEAKENHLTNVSLLVNTTSLGMVGQPDLKIGIGGLPDTAIVADIIYRPLKTSLLQKAEAAGHPICTGLGMLVHQGRPGFESMFGVAPSNINGAEQALIKMLGLDA